MLHCNSWQGGVIFGWRGEKSLWDKGQKIGLKVTDLGAELAGVKKGLMVFEVL